MFNLKHKLPIWMLGALVFLGIMVEWFFWDPMHGKALFNQVIQGNLMVGVMGILFLGVPVIIGWLYLMFGKDQFRPRLHWFWTPFGLLMVAWAWLTVWNTVIFEYGLSINTLLGATPELYRSIAFGLLIAFYSLASANPLWYFYWTWFIAGALTQGPTMLVTDLLPALFPSLGFLRASWSPYLTPEQVGNFWNYWGYFFLDCYFIPLGLVAGYFIIKWRKSVLEKEGERHPLFWGFWEGIGLPYVLIWRNLKKVFGK